jgi:hypothetical protein
MALVQLQVGSAADDARLQLLGAQWGGNMTPAEYAARERHLASHCAWMQRGGYTVWALVPAAAADDAADVLATCELFRMRALRAAGAPEDVVVFGVASVFTPPQLRMRGHASRLLDLVAERIAATSPEACALQLMCEIAPAIYEKCGYVAPQPAPHDWVFSASAAAPPAPGDVAHVRAADLPALAATAARLAERDLAARGVAGAVAVVPSAEQLSWHMERYAARPAVRAAGLAPEVCGATCSDAFAVWAVDMEETAANTYAPVLRVLLLCASADADATAAVLSAAVAAASAAGAPSGRTLSWVSGTLHSAAADAAAWAPPAAQLASRGVACTRESRKCLSVPMMKPLQPGVQPAAWLWVPRFAWV